MDDFKDLRDYSETPWVVILVAREMAAEMAKNELRESSAHFPLSGGRDISISMKR